MSKRCKSLSKEEVLNSLTVELNASESELKNHVNFPDEYLACRKRSMFSVCQEIVT